MTILGPTAPGVRFSHLINKLYHFLHTRLGFLSRHWVKWTTKSSLKQSGALFTMLTYSFDVSFGNFLLRNTLNFM